MLVPSATDSEFLRLKARSQLSLYPRAEHIVGLSNCVLRTGLSLLSPATSAQVLTLSRIQSLLMPGLEQ